MSQQGVKQNQSLKPGEVPSKMGLHQMCHLQLPKLSQGVSVEGRDFTELSGFCHRHVKKGCLLLPRVSLASGFQLQMKQRADPPWPQPWARFVQRLGP